MSEQPTHWLDIGPIPPPPKAEPEKGEFEEWFESEYKSYENSGHVKDLMGKAWHAALASKESKKGGA